jgi:hypothetical protein
MWLSPYADVHGEEGFPRSHLMQKGIKQLNFEFYAIYMTIYIMSSWHIPFLCILWKMNDMFFNILQDRIVRLLSPNKQNASTMAK